MCLTENELIVSKFIFFPQKSSCICRVADGFYNIV